MKKAVRQMASSEASFLRPLPIKCLSIKYYLEGIWHERMTIGIKHHLRLLINASGAGHPHHGGDDDDDHHHHHEYDQKWLDRGWFG